MKRLPMSKPSRPRQTAPVEPNRLAAIHGGDQRHPTIEPSDVTAGGTTTIS